METVLELCFLLPLFSTSVFLYVCLLLFSLSCFLSYEYMRPQHHHFCRLKKRLLDRFKATGASLVVWSKHFVSTSAFVCMSACLMCVHLYVLSLCVCVCGHINACMHVASSEEQWCIHYYQSEPRASPILMAVIIKKAFRE